MQLDEAAAIQQCVLKGIPVQSRDLKEAKRVMFAHHGAQGENRSWVPEPISAVQRDRVNMILVYRLAMHCGVFSAWNKARLST